MPISLGIDIEEMYSFKRGEQKAKKETILNLYKLNVLSIDQIAKAVGSSVSMVKRIIDESKSASNWHVPTMTYASRITANHQIMLGKPVINRTRITVELILRKLSEGATPADLVTMYPHLEEVDILAALQYAAAVLSNEDSLEQSVWLSPTRTLIIPW